MYSSDAAAKCFIENIRLFADARVAPEKFNLYNGLANISGVLGSLQAEIQQLRAEVSRLHLEVSKKK